MIGPPASEESNFHGHVTQKAVVFHKDDDILLVRSDSDNPWSIPGGRVQDGEDADEALKRELREETGLAVHVGHPVHAMTDVWFTADGEPMFTVVYDSLLHGFKISRDMIKKKPNGLSEFKTDTFQITLEQNTE